MSIASSWCQSPTEAVFYWANRWPIYNVNHMAFPCFKPFTSLRIKSQLLIQTHSSLYNLGPAYLSSYHRPLNTPSSFLPQSFGSRLLLCQKCCACGWLFPPVLAPVLHTSFKQHPRCQPFLPPMTPLCFIAFKDIRHLTFSGWSAPGWSSTQSSSFTCFGHCYISCTWNRAAYPAGTQTRSAGSKIKSISPDWIP